MHRQQARKQRRVSFKLFECSPTQTGVSTQEEKQLTHQKRPSGQTAVLGLVAFKLTHLQGIGKRNSLPEAEAQSFASDGIDTARRISRQSNILSIHPAQTVRCCDRAALRAAYLRTSQSIGKLGIFPPRIFKAHLWIARNKNNASFLGQEWSYVDLRIPAPMNLDAIRPGLHSIVSAMREADVFL